MARIGVLLYIIVLVFAAAGCRMCGSTNDYCIPAHIDREDDFRGCGPCYRAGSILYQAVSESNCQSCSNSDVSLLVNAGNYGRTIPVSQIGEVEKDFTVQPNQLQEQRQNMLSPNQPQQKETGAPAIKPAPIAKPPQSLPNTKPVLPVPSLEKTPDSSNLSDDPFLLDKPLPTMDEILNDNKPNQPLQNSVPPNSLPPNSVLPVPVTPPRQTGISPETETLPFVPSDPQPSFQSRYTAEPVTNVPEITIEELRKLDPTATDIQILNVEDRAINP